MPNYMYPYISSTTAYPAAYSGQSYNTAVPMPQSFAPQVPMTMPMQSNVIGVDGEVGAKAYMIPNGSTGPIALWDTNDNVIYMRTFNAAGMPNPLKKLRYVEEEVNVALPSQSGSTSPQIDMSQFVTKDDLEALRQEIRQMGVSHQNNSNYSNNQNGGQNRNSQGR